MCNILFQGFQTFFPGNPNFSIKILRDPKQKQMFTYQSYWEGWACRASQSLGGEKDNINLNIWKVFNWALHILIDTVAYYNPINNWTDMSWNCTAYFSDARALLLTERVIVLCVNAAHAYSFNYYSDYNITWAKLGQHLRPLLSLDFPCCVLTISSSPTYNFPFKSLLSSTWDPTSIWKSIEAK